MKIKYTDIKRQNTQFLAKFNNDESAKAPPGGFIKQMTQNENATNKQMSGGGGRNGSVSRDLSRSLLSGYKKEDKELMEKQ